ncbi:hypothetical protein [Bradyrhizobium sp. SZCCHNG3015]|uniref:phosphoribosyltransferase n=1 Tax=Bradyrhizobium sp. SZCCHNG3015 TaxID=3057270 RepID=UPI0028E5B02F|nr:hypothetical protein [Bradyrhizobium sp. SZCCHNG3015]
MQSVPLDLPQNATKEFTATVLCLRRSTSPGPFIYLQAVHSGKADPNGLVAQQYLGTLPFTVTQLCHLAKGIPFDAIVSPPTRFTDLILPYRSGVHAQVPDALDLTDRFTRSGNVFSGEDATVDNLLQSLDYRPSGEEPAYRHLAIIDDILRSGTTALTIVRKLREVGLPTDGQVTIICPLFLDNASTPGQT